MVDACRWPCVIVADTITILGLCVVLYILKEFYVSHFYVPSGRSSGRQMLFWVHAGVERRFEPVNNKVQLKTLNTSDYGFYKSPVDTSCVLFSRLSQQLCGLRHYLWITLPLPASVTSAVIVCFRSRT